MRNSLRWHQPWLALLCAGLLSSSLSAQVVRHGAAPRFPLLMDKAVQKELKLTEEQEKKIRDLMGDLFQEMPQGGEGGGQAITIRIGGGGVIGGGDMPDLEQIDRDIDKILDEKQGKRLNQIHLQRQGFTALKNEKIAKQLKITKEQQLLLDDLFEIHQEGIMKLLEEARSNAEGGFAFRMDAKGMKELREKLDKGVELILTTEQVDQWKEMLGPKFEAKR